MIKKVTFIMLLFALAKLSYPQASWSFLGTLPSGADINSIAVVDQNVIFVAAKGNYLYRTLNGGTTWELKNTGLAASGDLYGITATDSLNCWVGWLKTTGSPASIYKTTNGGTTWTSQWTLAGSFPDGLKMFTPSYGIAIMDPTATGQPYQFLYTKNGGTTWSLSPTSPIATSEFGVINDFDFIDTNIIWVGSANTLASATSAKIYRTTTGINGTWLNTVVTGSGGTAGLYYQAIAFTDKNNGMSGSNGSNLVKTTDGGVTWTAVTPPAGVTSFAAINMYGLKDGSNVIRLALSDGTAYKCFKTTNLGTNWTEEVLPSQGSTNGIQHMQFVNGSLGFAGGLAGTMLKYSLPVPVELTSFTAATSMGKVTLNWRTATELNNRGFEIQRKVDDNSWVVIAFKNGNGTTTSPNNYSYSDNISGLNANKLSYRLKQLDFNGQAQYSPVVLVDNIVPVSYSVSQNYPNPFNPSTVIKYQLPENSFVNLKVYNSLGQEVSTLVNGMVNAGTYEVQFNASKLTSGVYYYVIKAGENFVQTKKMMLVK
jgi:photosystem II stability/assembly factor-like uncharacterized protein